MARAEIFFSITTKIFWPYRKKWFFWQAQIVNFAHLYIWFYVAKLMCHITTYSCLKCCWDVVKRFLVNFGEIENFRFFQLFGWKNMFCKIFIKKHCFFEPVGLHIPFWNLFKKCRIVAQDENRSRGVCTTFVFKIFEKTFFVEEIEIFCWRRLHRIYNVLKHSFAKIHDFVRVISLDLDTRLRWNVARLL